MEKALEAVRDWPRTAKIKPRRSCWRSTVLGQLLIAQRRMNLKRSTRRCNKWRGASGRPEAKWNRPSRVSASGGRYSPRAVTDLAPVGDYLSERNPAAAVSVERRIRAVVERIALFPASGRILEERTDIRVIPRGNYPYRIFYTDTGAELIVLHITHSARESIEPGELSDLSMGSRGGRRSANRA